MQQVKFTVKATFQEFNGTNSFEDFYFFARDKENAKQIAKELLLSKHKQARNVQIDVSYYKPTREEVERVVHKYNEVYVPLKQRLTGLNYTEFLDLYQDLEGYEFKKNYDRAEFMFKFMGFVCKIKVVNGQTSLDDEEILYQSIKDNRIYVLRDECLTILIGI